MLVKEFRKSQGLTELDFIRKYKITEPSGKVKTITSYRIYRIERNNAVIEEIKKGVYFIRGRTGRAIGKLEEMENENRNGDD